MIEGLARALARIRLPEGGSLDAEEIADVLWLAKDPPEPPGVSTGPVTETAEPPGHRPDTSPGPLPPYDRLDEQVELEVPVYPQAEEWPPEPSATPVPASKVAFRSAAPLPHALELTRALRRFKQVTRAGRAEVDIEASVQATAESGHFMVVTKRPPVRALDLALVVDAGSSMRVWDRTFGELERVLAQVGAFRTVSRWTLHLRGDRVKLADPGGLEHPPSRLVDPSGSRLVLVATDAVGDEWYAPGIWRALETWATAMPSAVLQVLPHGYWPETAIGRPFITAQAARRGSPNASYSVRKAVWADDLSGVPMPVVALDPAALATWAEAVVAGTAWVEGVTTAPPEAGAALPGEVNRAVGAPELVRTFLVRASPGAIRLAQVLSPAPR